MSEARTRPRPPTVAVIGRQNVGKSTLVNRLFGRREAIAHDDPGVTRDRIEVDTTWAGRRFGLVDTAGYLQRARGVEALAVEQAARAAADADLVLLVTDVRSGITEEDAQLARRLRSSPRPVLLVVNKVDGPSEDPDAGVQPASPGPGPGEEAARRDDARRVQEALGHLDEEFREAVVLRDLDGLSYEEIAEATGAPVGTVRSRIHRGRAVLRERLLAEEPRRAGGAR